MIASAGAVAMAGRHGTGSRAKAERVDRSLKRRAKMYALLEAHPETAQELEAQVKAAKISAPLVAAGPARAIRKAERSATDKVHARIRAGEIVRDEDDRGPVDSGTGHTILKLRPKAITKLVDEGKLGQIELQGAAEILVAFNAIASRMMCRGINYERVDNSSGNSGGVWPNRVAHAVVRYQSFAKIWTQRTQDYGDSTLAILIDAVVDERWLRPIADDHKRRIQTVEKAIIWGLRDYAARAGWVTGQQAERWKTEAAAVFGPLPAELRKAMRRAAVET